MPLYLFSKLKQFHSWLDFRSLIASHPKIYQTTNYDTICRCTSGIIDYPCCVDYEVVSRRVLGTSLVCRRVSMDICPNIHHTVYQSSRSSKVNTERETFTDLDQAQRERRRKKGEKEHPDTSQIKTEALTNSGAERRVDRCPSVTLLGLSMLVVTVALVSLSI